MNEGTSRFGLPAFLGGSSAGGGAGAVQILDFVLDESAPTSGIVYGSWAPMAAAIAALPAYCRPRVTVRGTAVAPLAGMPSGGWDMRGAVFAGEIPATGTSVLKIEDGAELLDLAEITRGLLVVCSPTSSPTVLRFSSINSWVFFVTYGAAFVNSGSTPAIKTPGTGLTVVWAHDLASNNAVGPSAAPYVSVSAPDTLIGSHINCGNFGALPDDWASGDGNLLYQTGVDGRVPTTSGFVGTFLGNFDSAKAERVVYAPATPANWPTAPDDVAEALDVLAAGTATARTAVISSSGNFVVPTGVTVLEVFGRPGATGGGGGGAGGNGFGGGATGGGGGAGRGGAGGGSCELKGPIYLSVVPGQIIPVTIGAGGGGGAAGTNAGSRTGVTGLAGGTSQVGALQFQGQGRIGGGATTGAAVNGVAAAGGAAQPGATPAAGSSYGALSTGGTASSTPGAGGAPGVAGGTPSGAGLGARTLLFGALLSPSGANGIGGALAVGRGGGGGASGGGTGAQGDGGPLFGGAPTVANGGAGGSGGAGNNAGNGGAGGAGIAGAVGTNGGGGGAGGGGAGGGAGSVLGGLGGNGGAGGIGSAGVVVIKW